MTQNKMSFSEKFGFNNLKTVGLISIGAAVISLSLQKIAYQSLSCLSPYGQLLAEVDPQHHDDGSKKSSS
jgi:hypothetical protein